MTKKPGERAGYGASVKKAARKTKAGARKLGKAASKVAKKAGARKTASTSGPTRRSSIGSSIGKDGYRPRRDQRSRTKKQKTAAERGSRPVQERDTGPGGMTATGSKRRLGKAVIKNQKKYGTRVGTGSVSARKPSGKK